MATSAANPWSGGYFEYQVAIVRRNIVLELMRFGMLALTLDVRDKIGKRIWGRGLPAFYCPPAAIAAGVTHARFVTSPLKPKPTQKKHHALCSGKRDCSTK